MSKGVRLTILCEDLQQAVFAYRFFVERGFHEREITINRNPQGRGSGEQYVREKYAEEVKLCRWKSKHQSVALAVVIDADQWTVQEKQGQLTQALIEHAQVERQANERIAVFVPKRNIETWIHYLMDRDVDENTVYPKLTHEGDCKPLVRKLVREICAAGVPVSSPPSLQIACEELSHIL